MTLSEEKATGAHGFAGVLLHPALGEIVTYFVLRDALRHHVVMPWFESPYPESQREMDERMVRATENLANGARAATWLSIGSLAASIASLVVAIVALTVGR